MTTEKLEDAMNDSGGNTTSLKNLMATMVNQKCTFLDNESNSKGTIYLANGKVRGDFSTQQEGKTMSSHMISDSEYAYIWMDDLQTGLKVSMDSMEEVNDTGFKNSPKTVDIDQEVDYSCSSWAPDNSVFVVPTDRTFTDMSKAMEDMTDTMEGLVITPGQDATTLDKETACAGCDQAPPDLQEQCRIALGC